MRSRRAAVVTAWLMGGASVSTSLHAQVVLDGSLGPAGPLAGPTIIVPAESGQTRGGNLFHSFSQLNVAEGELLGFTGPTSVQNIIARVTGGSPSTIDGTIATNIPEANLYLINPAGVTFGPNAAVIVPGSFVATTADVVRLADGTGRFDATSPGSTVLTSAPPSAFGFLPATGGAARVAINDAFVNANPRTAMTFAGGEVRISGGFLVASSGRVNLAGVKDGTLAVDPANLTAAADASGVTTRGPVAITNSTLITVDGDANPGGDGAGGRVDVVASDATLDGGSRITSTTLAGAAGQGINLDASGTLTVAGGASLFTASQGAGRSGDLVLRGRDVRVLSQSGLDQSTSVTTFSFGPGRSGDVRVTADDVFVNAVQPDVATVSTAAGGQLPDADFAGSGAGGDVIVDATNVIVSGTGATLRTSTLNDQAAPGGNIVVTADTIRITAGAQVESQSTGNGVSGLIDVTARDLLVVRDAPDVVIPDLEPVPFQSSITTTTFIGSATAQGVRVRGGRVVVENRGSIDAQTRTADAAPITIEADTLELASGARVLADTSGAGSGGAIGVNVRVLSIDGDTTTLGSSTSGTGNGGAVNITASERVLLTGGSLVLSASIGDGSSPVGNGGAITVAAPDVEARDTSIFSVGTVDGGNGGQLTINADRILFSGSRAGVSSPTVVTMPNRTSGVGGRVELNATESIILERGARVSTIAGLRETGDAPAGTDTTSLTGVAGDATLAAPLVRVTGREDPDDRQSPSSRVTSVTNLKTPGAAAGGNVIVNAGTLEVTDGGLLNAGTTGSGAGGSVNVTAGDILIDNATVSASSTFAGDAGLGLTPGVGGSITLAAARSANLRNNALVSVEAVGTDGGNVVITATDRLRVTDSSVVTRANGTGGDITLGSQDPQTGNIEPFVILLDTAVLNANAVEGSGGNIRIISEEYVTSSDTIVTATSEKSNPGEIDVSAAYTELAGGLVRLPGALANDAARLKEQCGVRVQGEVSSFITTGRGGSPLSPEGRLPSFDLPKRAKSRS